MEFDKIKAVDEQRKEYRAYVEEHINNVMRAFTTLRSKLIELMDLGWFEANQLESAVIKHDQSKYSPEEFEPYRKNFNPINDAEKKANKEAFDKAWIHHYTNNPHHWNYWVIPGTKTAKPMSRVALAELICDWHAMSIKFKGTPLTFYEKNKDGIILHPETKELLEKLLHELYPNPELD